ncbi:MAG: fumarylacetoacetate hydrolase family protein, partial [Candidatus Omnitrophica bacterium]|nr:fumarylacetoacetate hydrolase family protein [Candidatus Omnitrophota bacterium]
SSKTTNMIFQVPELIMAITRYLTLYPGDIISTGTPEGISPIKNGDVVECEIEKIGILSNPVVSNDNNFTSRS